MVGGTPLVLQAAPIDRVELPLFRSSQDVLVGTQTTRDYVIQLPHHISARKGSQVRLALHPSPGLVAEVCAIRLELNGEPLLTTNIYAAPVEQVAGRILLQAEVPPYLLRSDWNLISLRFVLRGPAADSRELRENATWIVLQSEAVLSLAFQRLPPLPGWSQFPHDLTREKLLQPNTEPTPFDPVSPFLSVLLPDVCETAHLRAAALIGARLGQVGYLKAHDCLVAGLDSWNDAFEQGSAIVIALRDELDAIAMPIPANLSNKLASIGLGEGLVAWLPAVSATNHHKILLISGADEQGLEKAALTLCSKPALVALPAGPALIRELPVVPPALEQEAGPGPSRLRLDESRPLELRGLVRSGETFSDWRLPPGFQLGDDSVLNVRFTTSPSLVMERSFVEVLINGQRVGTFPLDRTALSPGSLKLALPKGLPGHDSMRLTFRTRLEPTESSCEADPEENAWVKVSADSILETTAEPVVIEGLDGIHRFLLKDRYARRAAYVVPAAPSLDQLRVLFRLWLDLGRNLSSSPVVWPEVVTYRGDQLSDPQRLKGRSVLLLGSVHQWSGLLSSYEGGPAIVRSSDRPGTVTIQNRKHSVAAFEPTLVFAELLRSPWSKDEQLVIAGGWDDYAIPAFDHMMFDPEAVGQLHSDLLAMDSKGRTVAYELDRVAYYSFAESLERGMLAGLTLEQNRGLLAALDTRLIIGRRWNDIVFWSFGGFLALLVVARLFLMGQQARVRQKAMAEERSLGGII